MGQAPNFSSTLCASLILGGWCLAAWGFVEVTSAAWGFTPSGRVAWSVAAVPLTIATLAYLKHHHESVSERWRRCVAILWLLLIIPQILLWFLVMVAYYPLHGIDERAAEPLVEVIWPMLLVVYAAFPMAVTIWAVTRTLCTTTSILLRGKEHRDRLLLRRFRRRPRGGHQ